MWSNANWKEGCEELQERTKTGNECVRGNLPVPLLEEKIKECSLRLFGRIPIKKSTNSLHVQF